MLLEHLRSVSGDSAVLFAVRSSSPEEDLEQASFAGGVILEIGGLLQHGALVAREYCKPCVAGIVNALDLFEDGQMIELDGSSGRVRLL